MSYSIFYRAMFIKMEDGTFIPMIESGDNNVWDCDGRRRSREWCSSRWIFETEEQRSRYSLSGEEIVANAQLLIDKKLEQYVGKEPAFGGEPYTRDQVLKDFYFFSCIHISGSSQQTASRFLNFFKSGIRNAVTMDEVSVFLSWYGQDDKYMKEYVSTEKDLADAWSRLRSQGITPWIQLSEYSADKAWRELKQRNKKERVRKTPEKYFLITLKFYGSDQYLQRLTGRHLWYTGWKDCAHKYATKDGAEHAAKRINGRFQNVTDARVVLFENAE